MQQIDNYLLYETIIRNFKFFFFLLVYLKNIIMINVRQFCCVQFSCSGLGVFKLYFPKTYMFGDKMRKIKFQVCINLINMY